LRKQAQRKPVSTGKTLLRSPAHVIVMDEKGNRLRSILVGMQFGILHLPGELLKVALWPFISNIAFSIHMLFDNTLFVLSSAWAAISVGFEGYLEASEEIVEENQQ
jgi:hypothetical protein